MSETKSVEENVQEIAETLYSIQQVIHNTTEDDDDCSVVFYLKRIARALEKLAGIDHPRDEPKP